MNELQKRFGNTIRYLRVEKDMSQEKLALLINMDRTYLASVELGKRNISLNNIKKLSDGLNISLSDLFKSVEKNN